MDLPASRISAKASNHWFSSVQFCNSIMSDSLQPHGLQQIRPPCPSSTPRAYPNSSPLRGCCHQTISVYPFSSCLQTFPESRSFQMSQLFTSGGERIGCILGCISISPSNEDSGLIFFRMDWLDLLAVQSILKSLIQHHNSKASILRHLAFFISPTLTSIHDYWKNFWLEKLWLDRPLLAK